MNNRVSVSSRPKLSIGEVFWLKFHPLLRGGLFVLASSLLVGIWLVCTTPREILRQPEMLNQLNSVWWAGFLGQGLILVGAGIEMQKSKANQRVNKS